MRSVRTVRWRCGSARAISLRDGQCMSCHVPNNPDKMKRLVLLQTPAHAAAEIQRVIASVDRDRMPFDEFGIEKPLKGEIKGPLLERARAREVWRPQVLRRSVPVLHRVSSHRWFHEPDIERARLREAVTHALGERN